MLIFHMAATNKNKQVLNRQSSVMKSTHLHANKVHSRNANALKMQILSYLLWKVPFGKLNSFYCIYVMLLFCTEPEFWAFALLCFGKHMRLILHCDTLSSSVYEQKQDALWSVKAIGWSLLIACGRCVASAYVCVGGLVV